MAGQRRIGKLLRDRRGATAVEYGLVVALIVIGLIAAIASLGQVNLGIWKDIAAKVIGA
jgi:pilus assembly protein Flp/PilA